MTTLDKFHSRNENQINLYLNHLAVVYMFFVPFEPHGYAVSFIFFLMYSLIIVRGNYLKYLKISLSNPLTLPFMLMMLVHYIWMYGNDCIEGAHETLKYSHYFLYPLFFFLFLDHRFYPRLLGSFLAGLMLSSETLSYLMQFDLIPRGFEITFQVPWKENGLHIVFYRSVSGEPSPFLDHSWYSTLLATAASIFFYKGLISTQFNHKILNFIFFTSISINLFFIGGRTGYVLYLLLISTIILLMARKKTSIKNILSALSLPIVIVLLMYQTSPLFHQRVDHTFHSIKSVQTATTLSATADGSFNEKALKAQAALKLISNNLLWGVGTGDQLFELRSNPDNMNNPIQKYRDVHNQYLDILMQFGIIGFLFYLYLLYTIARHGIVSDEKNMVKTIALIGMIFTGFLLSFWYFIPVLFTTLIIISTANTNTIENKLKQTDPKTVMKYALMILLSYTVGILQ